jgi:hypothetical protein
MGKTLHIYTQLSKSWNIYFGGDLHSCTWLSKAWYNQIGAGGPIFWYN